MKLLIHTETRDWKRKGRKKYILCSGSCYFAFFFLSYYSYIQAFHFSVAIWFLWSVFVRHCAVQQQYEFAFLWWITSCRSGRRSLGKLFTYEFPLHLLLFGKELSFCFNSYSEPAFWSPSSSLWFGFCLKFCYAIASAVFLFLPQLFTLLLDGPLNSLKPVRLGPRPLLQGTGPFSFPMIWIIFILWLIFKVSLSNSIYEINIDTFFYFILYNIALCTG